MYIVLDTAIYTHNHNKIFIYIYILMHIMNCFLKVNVLFSVLSLDSSVCTLFLKLHIFLQ